MVHNANSSCNASVKVMLRWIAPDKFRNLSTLISFPRRDVAGSPLPREAGRAFSLIVGMRNPTQSKKRIVLLAHDFFDFSWSERAPGNPIELDLQPLHRRSHGKNLRVDFSVLVGVHSLAQVVIDLLARFEQNVTDRHWLTCFVAAD